MVFISTTVRFLTGACSSASFQRLQKPQQPRGNVEAFFCAPQGDCSKQILRAMIAAPQGIRSGQIAALLVPMLCLSTAPGDATVFNHLRAWQGNQPLVVQSRRETVASRPLRRVVETQVMNASSSASNCPRGGACKCTFRLVEPPRYHLHGMVTTCSPILLYYPRSQGLAQTAWTAKVHSGFAGKRLI